MVYLSEKHTTDAPPWAEYRTRMQMGVKDAMMLGISQSYVDNEIEPYLSKVRDSQK